MASEFGPLIASGSKDVPWYTAELKELKPVVRELLENYSHISKDRVNEHVIAAREKAWSIFAYPCIGQWRFLDLSISLQPAYERVLSLLKEPNSKRTLLDLGCCFAQDIRKLIYDGVPSENLYGSDLKPDFLELGYDLFADRDKCKAHFFSADVFDEGSALGDIAGQIDIIYAASFLHLFSWDDQVKVAKRVIKTLRPQKGSLVFGRQSANIKGQEAMNSHRVPDAAKIWRHDVESFTRLWDLAGEETGTKWKTWAELYEAPKTAKSTFWREGGARMMRFEVTRLD